MLFAGLGPVRLVKNCDLGLENAALGLRPRAAFSRPRSQFFTRRTSQLANNIYIFSRQMKAILYIFYFRYYSNLLDAMQYNANNELCKRMLYKFKRIVITVTLKRGQMFVATFVLD